jgi:hypothetical protein
VTDERGTSVFDLLTSEGRRPTSSISRVCLTDNAEVNDSSPRSTTTVTSVEAVSLRPD